MKVSNEMVQRFLGWRLPDDFYPDGGVTFNREVNGGLRPKTWWPVGTNLLTDPQARAMLEHVVGPEFDALLARCEAVEARLAEAHDLLALAAGVALLPSGVPALPLAIRERIAAWLRARLEQMSHD